LINGKHGFHASMVIPSKITNNNPCFIALTPLGTGGTISRIVSLISVRVEINLHSTTLWVGPQHVLVAFLVSPLNGSCSVNLLARGFGVALMLNVATAQNDSIQIVSNIQLA
jgi:hypothetical protein